MEQLAIFQERLLLTRRRRGLSQELLATQAHLLKTDISKYERGISLPSLPRLVRLAQVLDVSTDYLLGREPPAPDPSEPDVEHMTHPDLLALIKTLEARIDAQARHPLGGMT